MITQEDIKTFASIFSGAQRRYGKLYFYDEKTGEKDCYEEKEPIPIENHLTQKEYLGRSPLNEDTNMCEWLGVDIDIKIPPKTFCADVWSKLGTHYFPFMTKNRKWRVIEFLDEPMDVQLAHKRAKELQKRIENELGIETDQKSTAPTEPSSDGAVGRWFFLPYGNGYDVCYSPGGHPLTLQQFYFRYKYRNHPIVVCGIGIDGGGNDGSRGNHFYYVKLYKK